jgi:hypothetical protein
MIEPTKRPERLFRYFSPGQSQIFAEQKLWFSSASDFNDVFEALPRHDQLIEEITEDALEKSYAFLPPKITISYSEYKSLSREWRSRIIEKSNEEFPDGFQARFSKFYGIVCFTEHLNSLLMWGHYTDCHRGFVIEFDPQHDLFTPRDCRKACYGENRPVFTKASTAHILLCKSSEWAYEDEHRIIRPKTELSQGTYSRNGIETEGHFVPLPTDAIKAVYFGCRIAPEHRHNLLKPLEAHPHIERYFMRKSRTAYKLDVVPWNEWKAPTGLGSKILNLPFTGPP